MPKSSPPARLGHLKFESTVRYLGIEVDNAIRIAEKIDISGLLYLYERTCSAVG
jgi:hypothetical protein